LIKNLWERNTINNLDGPFATRLKKRLVTLYRQLQKI